MVEQEVAAGQRRPKGRKNSPKKAAEAAEATEGQDNTGDASASHEGSADAKAGTGKIPKSTTCETMGALFCSRCQGALSSSANPKVRVKSIQTRRRTTARLLTLLLNPLARQLARPKSIRRLWLSL